MPPTPASQRFVRIRLPAGSHPAATITLNGSTSGAAPKMDDHPIVLSGPGPDPARAAAAQLYVARLLTHEKAVLDWLSRDPSNTMLFLNDPLEALTTALPGIDPASLRFDG